MKPQKGVVKISPEVLHYLRDMTDDVRAHGIQPIIVLQGMFKDNVLSLAKVRFALPRVPIVDMSHFLINPKEHALWFNLSHLNIKGRYLYNQSFYHKLVPLIKQYTIKKSR